jgi:hypothetical protein
MNIAGRPDAVRGCQAISAKPKPKWRAADSIYKRYRRELRFANGSLLNFVPRLTYQLRLQKMLAEAQAKVNSRCVISPIDE